MLLITKFGKTKFTRLENVFFHFADKRVPLNDTRDIQRFISTIFKREGVRFSRIDYIFCSDEYLLQINKEFLDQDYYTDIISFALNKPKASVIGEIYISPEMVKYNSKEYNVLFQEEMRRVLFHGALHLCGYNDKTKKQQQEMTLLENKYLNLYKTYAS